MYLICNIMKKVTWEKPPEDEIVLEDVEIANPAVLYPAARRPSSVRMTVKPNPLKNGDGKYLNSIDIPCLN